MLLLLLRGITTLSFETVTPINRIFNGISASVGRKEEGERKGRREERKKGGRTRKEGKSERGREVRGKEVGTEWSFFVRRIY